MHPMTLTLSGFKGITATGREKVILDLTQIPEESKLIALVGMNGAGKSTLLDNLHPYRIMPSRSTGMTPASFSYWEELVVPGEASKELTWQANGRSYKSHLLWRSTAKTKKTEAYLFEEVDGTWQPARLSDGTLSDGKTETYDAVVEGIIGAPELFFSSIFACQGKQGLHTLENGDAKKLLSVLLGLEDVRATGAEVKAVCKGLLSRLEFARKQQTAADELAQESKQKQARVMELAANRVDVVGRQLIATSQVRQAREALDDAKTEATKAQSTIERRTHIRKRREKLDSDTRAEQDALGKEEQALQQQLDSLEQGHKKAESVHQEAQQLIAKEGANLRTLVGRKAEIEAAERSTLALSTQEASLLDKFAAAEKIGTQGHELARALEVLTAGINARIASGKSTRSVCEQMELQGELAKEVPCQGTDLQGRCKLLVDAVAAKPKLETAKATLVKLTSEHHQDVVKQHQLQSQLTSLGNFESTITTLKAYLEATRTKLKEYREVAALRAQLDVTEVSLQHLATRRAQASASWEAQSKSFAMQTEEKRKSLDTLVLKGKKLCEQVNAQIDALEKEDAALPATPDPNKVVVANATLVQMEETLDKVRKGLAAADAELARLGGEITQLHAREKEIGSARQEVTYLECELEYWQLLALAFGDNGIIALCIDDAGPALSAITNDLLLSCYGGRFLAEIRTQVKTAKGDLREGFDIVVHDADRDGEAKSVSKMSGGERVWINDALTRAVAIYLAQSSGRQFDTLFSDETDGPLDPDRKRSLFAMKRAMLDVGGYKREFFVSQTPEIQEMADWRIDVSSL